MIHWRNCLTALELASSYCHAKGTSEKWWKLLFVVPFPLYCHADGNLQRYRRARDGFELRKVSADLVQCRPFVSLFFFFNLSLLTSWKIEISPSRLWQHTLDSNKNILEMPVSWSSNKVRLGRISGKAAWNPLENNRPLCYIKRQQCHVLFHRSNSSRVKLFQLCVLNSPEWLLLHSTLISRLFQCLNCPLICVTSGPWW